MKKVIKTISCILAVILTVSMFSVSFSAYAEGNNIIGDYDFTIVDNPYENIEWDSSTLHAFKASTHAHTVRSDADIELNDTIWYHYMSGYEAMCLTDHGTVNGYAIKHNGVVTGMTGANGTDCGWTNNQDRCAIYGYQSFVHGNIDEISTGDYYNIINGQQVGTYGDRPQALVDAGRGMFNIPLGNEANAITTNKCHVNTYNVSFGHGANRTASWPADTVREAYDVGAFSRINHVGEWAGGNDDPGVYDESWVNDFVDIFEEYCPNRTTYTESDSKWNHTNITGQQVKKGVIGIELVNTSDNRTRNDRFYVYDASLKQLAPQGINMYGFCEDDSHEESDINKNAQYFLVNDGNAWSQEDKEFYGREYPDAVNPWYGYTGNLLKSMTNGEFFASSVNSKNSYELGDGFTASGAYPSVNYFNFNDEADQVTLRVNNAQKIRIVADGVILDTTTINQSEQFEEVVFDLNEYEDNINSYIRIYLTGKGGITYLQPILLSKTESRISTVEFITPSTDTKVNVFDANGILMSPANNEVYVLPAGNYTYVASRPGYLTTDPIPFTVTQAQINNAEKVVINVELEKNNDIVFTTFYVPETIYLNPTDSTNFQYYVDRNSDGLLESTIKQTGNVHFYREGAKDISIGFKVVDGSSLKNLDYTVDKLSGEEVAATITGGSLTSALASGGKATLEWTASYKVNGQDFESKAYSYIYAPLRGAGSVAAAGGYANTKKAAGWLHSAMDVTGTVWIAGVHSVSGGNAAYKFAPYGGEAMVNASGVGNITTTGVGMSTSSDDSSGGSVSVYPQGSSATLSVDISRYSNFNQIPGLSVGLDMNSANSCDSVSDSTIQYVNFGSQRLYTLSGVAANTLGGQRLFVSDNTNPDKDIDLAIDSSVPSINVVGQVYGYKSSRSDSVIGTVTLNLLYVDKAPLRQQVENAINSAYQRNWFENESDYDSFISTLKSSSLVLGNPAATQNEVTSATTKIKNANDNVQLKKGSATVNYVDVKSGKVIETTTSEFTITDTIIFTAEEIEGYNYNKSWECVVGSTVAKSGTDTFASIMTTFESCNFNFYYIPNTYAVTFNSWDDDYSPIGGTGYTATLNDNFYLPSNVPEMEGHTFTGWYFDLDGGIYKNGATIKWNYTEAGSFTAQFEANTYTAYVDLDGGTGFNLTTFNCKYNDFFDIPLVTPTKGGHAFAGWQATSVSGKDLGIHVPGGRFTWDAPENVYFKALWTVVDFNVTFEANGGNIDTESKVVSYGSAYGTLPTPTREGYVFGGWYLDEALTKAVNKATIVESTEDHTLYAKWTIGKYSVTYYVDGAIYSTENYDFGAKVTPIAAPRKVGHTFSGWSEIPSTMPAGNVTVRGSFSVNSYTVTYVIDGKTVETQTYNYGESITAIAAPKIDGYTFSGWQKVPSTMPAENITITGDYDVNTYSIFYYVDGNLYTTQTATYGQSITPIAAPSKNGYVFSGWSEFPSTMPAEDITINGTFTGKPFIITYYVDGVEYKSETYNYGDKITPLAAPEKPGYTFSGWSSIPATMPQRNVKVNGLFTANTYTYKFVLDGVEKTAWTITAKCGTAITAPVPTVAEGYKFSGWSPVFPETMGPESMTFYGTTSKEYSVYTFDINGATGSAPEAKKYSVGTEVNLPADDTFAKTGYSFSGWSEDKNASAGVTKTTVKDENTTMFAIWTMMNIYIESADKSTTIIDEINDLICGIAEMLTPDKFESDYIELIGSNGDISYETGLGFGTDTKVFVKDTANNKVVATYTLVVYGDVDGDGVADGQDVVLAQMLCDGILTEDSVSKAVFEAADCNHDGEITVDDVNEIINAGLLTFEIIQTK